MSFNVYAHHVGSILCTLEKVTMCIIPVHDISKNLASLTTSKKLLAESQKGVIEEQLCLSLYAQKAHVMESTWRH